jgi:hypothetical protein
MTHCLHYLETEKGRTSKAKGNRQKAKGKRQEAKARSGGGTAVLRRAGEAVA